ncbi:phosphoenolpyruvate-protein phosphotransferase [Candidatus Tenderia electrophaga]|jgi:phosphotransferase system enzyme I (PtsI)|uniref:Phosphoenolpyruvate-protein phosphotransferase n=1 Tax=Candidatus Tenderia electrophaga TaxID=1748243 RepID=A0A0S2T979_9GAMM|nr:phosphoenolpyruvate-protein phosphotransferase [Candidatus Tenderia electrophaga]
MASLSLKGVGVSRGIAVGKAYLLQRDQLKVREYLIPPSLVEAEQERFKQAVATAKQQLAEVRQRIPQSTPVDIVSFIDTHLLMLNDKALAQAPLSLIRERGCNAEWALKLQRDALVAVFEDMDDAYLRTRRDDVDHVVDRIQRILLNQVDNIQVMMDGRLKGKVIIADDLSPADTVTMQNEGIVAFVTEFGGPNSHTTILARSLGIPAVVGVKNALRYLRQSEMLVVDGYQGVLLAAPDARGLAHYAQRQREEKRHQSELNKLKELPAVSRDGLAISLQANVEIPEDLAVMNKVAAKGVGLYRTEYLFMNRDQPPDEEEQYQTYREVVKRLRGRPLTIRTLDLGADKTPGYEARPEVRGVVTNPALGLRAIRLCLRDTALFLTQLRAILRVSAEGPINMMIPMLASVQELQQAMVLINQAKEELLREGKPIDENVPVGGMIEVPAAALLAHVFAKQLDFLSIGTNDLVQYTMAADRLDNAVNYLYQPTHPAVLRLIDMTIKAGRKAGIPVAMCGEMAGESRYTRLLLGLGLTEFSMQPAMLPEVKSIIQESDVEQLTKRVRRVLRMSSAPEVDAFLEKLNDLV